MESVFSSLFPNIHYTGAFLTPGLREAFTIPLIQESEIRKKSLEHGTLFIQLENGHTYIGNGTVFFGSEPFSISMTVRPASQHNIEMNALGASVPLNLPIPKLVTIPSLFKGVGNEIYLLGVIDVCDRAESQ